MRSLIVNEKFNNKKLSAFLIHSFPKLSFNSIFKALRKKDIKVKTKEKEEVEIEEKIVGIKKRGRPKKVEETKNIEKVLKPKSARGRKPSNKK